MNNWVKTVFRHDGQNGSLWYSVAVAGKDGQGNKVYEYWPADFPKGTEIPDRSRVELKDFFISFYTKNDGTVQHKFVVQDFIVSQQQPQQGYAQPPQYQQAAYPGYPPQQYQQPPQYYNGAGYPQAMPPRPAQPPVQQPVQQQAAPDFEQIDEDVPF